MSLSLGEPVGSCMQARIGFPASLVVFTFGEVMLVVMWHSGGWVRCLDPGWLSRRASMVLPHCQNLAPAFRL
eukprot:5200982-Ditylum_brightwellii.AAC.1